MTDYVMTGLVKRRAELLREAKAADVALRALIVDIERLDGAIRTYDKAYRPCKVALRRAPRSHLVRIALEALRAAGHPMTLRDITAKVLTAQGGDAADKEAVTALMEKMRATLIRQRKTGAVRSAQGPGQFVLWEVAR